ncbi:hypothetical protein [Rhodococcus sp. IEGM 1408]|uniref:hypothetical protein n=1 Tax=Rhodococcus sp. IEGM 1408 TaxID=3082220 RepID=UPI0029559906|nr:hypothetical protein [Rhodococcus sp. IEGM 1408]MDV8001185.1 hypothetical protein [Rhodococcus sp. IEGM 1408]
MENNGSPPRTDPGSGCGSGPYDVAAALADVDAARQSVADRLITPWWYHPALGTILAAIMLVSALDLHNFVRLPVALVGAVGIGLLVGAYQRMTGLWVDLRNLGPTSRKWWLAYAVIVAVSAGASLVPTFREGPLPWWLAVLLAAVALVATIVLGRGVDGALREEIRSGVAALPRSRR